MLNKTLSQAKKKQRNILIKAMNNDIGSINSAKDSWNPAQISERAKDISYIRSLVDTWNPAQLNEALRMLDLPVIDTWNPAQIEEQRRNLVFYLSERTLTGNPITLKILGNLTPEVTGLKVTMNPIQSGSGDPSPTNIRPISGRTEASVTRTGKNILYKTIEGVTIGTNGAISANSSYNIVIAQVLQGKTYTFSLNGVASVAVRSFFTAEPASGSSSYNGERYTTDNTFVSPITGYVAIRTSTNATNIQLENGSTATEYTPYVETETHTHQYSETIYGGVDDFMNGGLTNTKKYIELDANSNWDVGEGAVWFFIGGDSDLPTGTIIDSRLCSNMFKNGYNQDGSIWVIYKQIHIRPNSTIAPSGATAEGLAEFKNWLSTNNYKIQVCVDLATPTTIETSAEEITLLKGENVLSTDGDSIELKYKQNF